jgi:hypothetical protein
MSDYWEHWHGEEIHMHKGEIGHVHHGPDWENRLPAREVPMSTSQCQNKAVWWMQGKISHDWTLSCNEHVEYMKWDDHKDTYPYVGYAGCRCNYVYPYGGKK